MKLLVSDYNQLEFWISNQLNRLNNDNPEVLAKLVISLVKQDREQSTLDSYYEEQLKTFLKDKTKSFVLSLLSAIKGSWINLFIFYFICFCIL